MARFLRLQRTHISGCCMRKKLLFLLCLFGWYAPLRAQQHDPSFHDALFLGSNGAAYLEAVVRQADGHYLVVGNFTNVDGHPTRGVARLLPGGRPDTAFTCSYLPRAASGTNLVAVQPDGRVLVTSDAANPLIRLLPNGAPDATFSLDTAAVVRAGLRYGAAALIVQPDGRIIVAGWRMIARLNSNGTLDPSFQAAPLGMDTWIRTVCLEPTGRLAYAAYDGQLNQGITGRLLPSGIPDPSFTPLQLNRADATHLLRLPDGRYLLAGEFRFVANRWQNILRLLANGMVDSTFAPYSTGGVPGSNTIASAVRKLAVQNDGRILAASGGPSLYGSGAIGVWASLVRCMPNDGTRDLGFNENYIYRADSIGSIPNTRYNGANAMDLLVDPDGKVLVAGRFARVGGQPSGGLTRLLAAQVLATEPATASGVQVWPNPAHSQLYLQFQGAQLPQQVTLLDVLGRPVQTLAPAGRAALTLGTAGLAAGVYLLRLQYEGQAVTRRVVLE
jgi:uncharacterized delta-60 repeat protein